MYKINKSQKRLPFGGHHFYDPNGGLMKGESPEEVAEKVKDFRLNNNIPLGDPMQEILKYYSMHFPYMVKVDEEYEPEEVSERYLAWRAWVQKTWKNPHKKSISKKEASLRWEACSKCPYNVKKNWVKSDESDEIERRAMLLRRGINVSEKIGFCSLHGWDLSIASFIDKPDDFSEKPKNIQQPVCCWV